MTPQELFDLVSYCRGDLRHGSWDRTHGILVEAMDGGVRIVATDGWRMAIAEVRGEHDVTPGRYDVDGEPVNGKYVEWRYAVEDLGPDFAPATSVLTADDIAYHVRRIAGVLLGRRRKLGYEMLIDAELSCELRIGDWVARLDALFLFDAVIRCHEGAEVRYYGTEKPVEIVGVREGARVRHIVMPLLQTANKANIADDDSPECGAGGDE